MALTSNISPMCNACHASNFNIFCPQLKKLSTLNVETESSSPNHPDLKTTAKSINNCFEKLIRFRTFNTTNLIKYCEQDKSTKSNEKETRGASEVTSQVTSTPAYIETPFIYQRSNSSVDELSLSWDNSMSSPSYLSLSSSCSSLSSLPTTPPSNPPTPLVSSGFQSAEAQENADCGTAQKQPGPNRLSAAPLPALSSHVLTEACNRIAERNAAKSSGIAEENAAKSNGIAEKSAAKSSGIAEKSAAKSAAKAAAAHAEREEAPRPASSGSDVRMRVIDSDGYIRRAAAVCVNAKEDKVGRLHFLHETKFL